MASGLGRIGNNTGLYVKLLRHVANDVPNTLATFSKALENQDAAAVRAAAHSLKGASGNLSLLAVAEAADHLEEAARREDFDAMRVCFDSLRQALLAYAAVVNSLDMP